MQIVNMRKLLTILILPLLVLCGCTVVSYDRAFPKLTWAWTDQAKEQRRQNREHEASVQAYKDGQRTNSPVSR